MTPMFFHRSSRRGDEPVTTTVTMVAGLGNPGREYRNSRHNIGFMLIDRLARQLNVQMSRVQNRSIVGSTCVQAVKLILAKPQTFMNLSGEAVGGLIRFYKIPLERIIVVYDDIDLPFGTLRLRPSGSSAGHKGMQSIIERLGTQDFARVRVGVGRPPGSKQGAFYVLQDFAEAEQAELDVLLDQTAEAIKVFIHDGIDQAMNQFNGPVFED